jgi:hypothetical protein
LFEIGDDPNPDIGSKETANRVPHLGRLAGTYNVVYLKTVAWLLCGKTVPKEIQVEKSNVYERSITALNFTIEDAKNGSISSKFSLFKNGSSTVS